MVSDTNGDRSTSEELGRETAIAEAYMQGASGWSYVPAKTANQFPFDYRLAESSVIEDSWPATRRHPAYFRAMLENIAKIVLRKPPSTGGKRK